MEEGERVEFEGGGFEMTPHTADIGIRVFSKDWPGLLMAAARGMFACIGELKPLARQSEIRRTVQLAARSRPELLRDWLAELLYWFERDRAAFNIAELHVSESAGKFALLAEVAGQPYDPVGSALMRELKAVTYHGLRVDQTADGWTAEVVFDI